MRRKALSLSVLVLLLGFGLAACGGDEGGGEDELADAVSDAIDDAVEQAESEGDSGEFGDSGESTGESTDTTTAPAPDGPAPEGVEGFCFYVQQYVDLLGQSIDDPGSVDTELAAAGEAYATAAIGLGELTPEEQVRFDECSQLAADAAQDLLDGD